MKLLFGIIGLYLGVLVGDWEGAVFGGVIGILTGTLIQYRKRIVALEEKVSLIQSNLIGSKVELTGSKQEEVVAAPPPAPEETEAEDITIIPPESPVVESDATTEVHDSNVPPPPPVYTDPITRYLKHFFTTGNVVVKVGVIVLFFGVAFLLKYAADKNLFPIELRLASVAVGGIVMLIVGWKLRLKKQLYALVLQGGAVGVLYLTVFTAARMYTVLPLNLAFFIMLALVIFSCALAVIQDSKALAVFAAAGGFLAPALTSTGQGSHVALFSYYGLLNAGILLIAWHKAWRSLNWVGFVFTFVIASLWGYRYYQPQFFNTTEPFLVLFFLFYVAIAVLFAHRQPPELKGLVDGSLVFGTPLVGFTLQSQLIEDFEFGQAYSALAMGVFYILLAKVLWKKQIEGMRLLTESFLALGIIFGSLAIPLALDGRWTAAAWAVEGAGIAWIGIRQNRLLARAFGLILQLGASIAFLSVIDHPHGYYPILNSAYIGSVLIGIAGLYTGYQYFLRRDQVKEGERDFHIVLLIWGLCWWFGAGFLELEQQLAAKYELNGFLFYTVVSMYLISLLAREIRWHTAEFPPVLLLPAMVLFALMAFLVSADINPLANYGFVSWIAAFVVQYGLLYLSEKAWGKSLIKNWHAGTLWLLIFLLTWIIAQALTHHAANLDSWGNYIWGVIPAVVVMALLYNRDRIAWPVKQYKTSYLSVGVFPVAVYLATWIVVICFYEGDPRPLPYYPIINPQDVAQLFAMIVLFDWLGFWKRNEIPAIPKMNPDKLLLILTAIAFIWLNSLVAHAVHFYADVRYAIIPMFRSELFQSSISIVWTLTAFLCMGLATRKGWRQLWFTGAALLAAVVIKLFIIDLADTGTVARIVSFLSVGGLMLIIGYFSPLPPRQVGQE